MPPNNLNTQNNSSISNPQQDQSVDLIPHELSKKSMPKAGKVFGIIIAATVGVLLISFGIVYLMKYLSDQANQSKSHTENSSTIQKHIDLQPTLDKWLSKQVSKKNSGIIIYDLNNQEIVGRNNDFSQFNMTGIEDLFMIYESYSRLEQQKWHLSDQITVSGKQTTREICLSRVLRENNETCRNFFLTEIGLDSLKTVIKDHSYTNTNLDSHLSNATDLLTLLKRLVSHPDFSDTLWRDLKDKMNLQNQELIGFNAGFSKLEAFGYSGFLQSQIQDPKVPSTPRNYLAYNGAFLLEKSIPDSDKKHSFLFICLTSDTNPAELTELAKFIEAAILE